MGLAAARRQFTIWNSASGHKELLPIHDRKRRIVLAPAYAAPQTRRRQAAIVARDPNLIQRPHSAGAQQPLSPRAVIRSAENQRSRPAADGHSATRMLTSHCDLEKCSLACAWLPACAARRPLRRYADCLRLSKACTRPHAIAHAYRRGIQP